QGFDWQNCNNPCFRVKRAARTAALESIDEETFSMNKKLMALAVAGAVTAPGLAVAQIPTQIATPAGVASNAGITLYGRLDETIMNQKFSSTTNANIVSPNVTELKKADLYSPGNAMGI